MTQAADRRPEVALTDSARKGYIRFSSLSAGVAKLAYAADSKWKLCSLCPLLNSSQPSETIEENHLDTLPPLAGLFGNF